MRFLIILWCWGFFAGMVLAEEISVSQADIEFFESKIRPVLTEHCSECHAADARQVRGGLLLDRPSGLRTGGDSGPAVVPGNVQESLLIAALRHESFEMPPAGKLPEEVIANFVTWIERGAIDPRPDEPVKSQDRHIDLDAGRQFWAFQAPRASAVPEVQQANWPRDDVDRFLLAKLEAAGIAPTSDASRAELLRRLSFDLTGLPPTPQEILDFQNDNTPNAVERLVDRLLATPQFGERWGRHWLDVARYADSTGGGRSMLYGESWYYRNYVIAAFNRDKPFDQFIVEQIAGDLLTSNELQQQRDYLAATAFLALGPTNLEMQDKKQLRMEVIDEQIDTTGRAFLAMTIGCARCHDHKFDPIPQTDYYALASIFRNTQTLIDSNVSDWIKRPLPVDAATQQQVAAHQELLKQQRTEIEQLKSQIKGNDLGATGPQGILIDDDAAVFTGAWTESTSVKPFTGRGYRHASTPEDTAVFRADLKPGRYQVFVGYTLGENRCSNTLVLIDHKTGQEKRRLDQRRPTTIGTYVSLGEFEFGELGSVTLSGADKQEGVMVADAVLFAPVDTVPATTQQVETERLAAEQAKKLAQAALAQAETKLKELEKTGPKIPQLPSIRDFEKLEDCPLHIRGSIKNLGDPVPRGFLTVATAGALPEFPATASGRLELAQWLASPENPLTARVYVNRVWSKLFGQGLVRTVDNFGSPGERPSHPELLDQLALDFIAEGWSTKRLVRRLVLTRAYQLSVSHAPHTADPDNRLLAHQNRQRLDAECLHDALLALSGELQLAPVENAVREGTTSEYGYEFEIGPRAVYLPMFRNQLPDLFATFDFPNPNLSTGRRNVSTLSTQALFLMNSPFIQDRAQHTAEQLLQEPGTDAARLEVLYLTALSRVPTPTESTLLQDYLTQEAAAGVEPLEAWSRVVQVVLCSLDFRYR